MEWKAEVYARQQENITKDEEFERTKLATQGKKGTQERGKNEVLEIKNQSDRDVAEMGLFMGCKEEEKIEGSSMFDMKGKPRIELKETTKVLGLSSTINPLHKHNKVEDLDNPQLQPCAVVQFAREP
ncbi:hypothetical protein CR513_41506, partial [Mucuna pruriens]